MRARFIQRSECMDFCPPRDIDAGEIVKLGHLIGITKTHVLAGTLGTLFLNGIFDIQNPDGMVFQPGECVYCDANGKLAKSGTLIGVAIPAIQNSQQIVRILLNNGVAEQESHGQDAEWQPL